ncbi:MAG: response regulator [Planctomycetes bacterium]|nr:response regulator [Planctomycetota bacterium]
MTATRTILVVDDEPFISRALTFILKKNHYRVLEARDGEEALALVANEHPDLVFLDVMMPRMSGFEVAERIRADASCAATKIILLTAKGQDADRAAGEALADAYMTKPFSPTRILERARALLGE